VLLLLLQIAPTSYYIRGESSIFEEMLRSNKSDCTKLISAIGKDLVSKRLLRVNPTFEKLIISLRTAYARDLLNYPLRRG
jgi:hypothetical protein